MSTSNGSQLIGAGVYSLTEAERITRIPRRRIRRWMEGYSFESGGRRRHSPPIVASTIGRSAGELGLTFSDLIEVRFLDRFLQEGVSWHSIRTATERARELLGRLHPFSTRIFKTDGHAILAEIVRPGDDPALLNLVNNQWELERIVSPMLYAGLEFDELDEPRLWRPLVRSSVVLDPRRAFGAPIIDDVGVPTAVLATAARTEGTQMAAAAVYDVPVRAVRHAVTYERHLAA